MPCHLSSLVIWKATLNLPKTSLPIRAGLVDREPKRLDRWEKDQLYERILSLKKSRHYCLHDGPPYPSGDIHMGHAMNKILKDIIMRFQTMSGATCPYVPGWDCHGLPIEIQVQKQRKLDQHTNQQQDIPRFRQQCASHAMKYVNRQRDAFKRLGVLGQWDKPYLTLDPSYEANVVGLFGNIAHHHLIYRGRRPVHWCISCKTALAEAEIEYHDRPSPSIFVRFPVVKPGHLSKIMGQTPADFWIWTTTPWTLPANVAVAAHPDHDYVVLAINDRCGVFMADRCEDILMVLKQKKGHVLGTIKGKDLTKTVLAHPFLDRDTPVVTASFIDHMTGSGLVHIAPPATVKMMTLLGANIACQPSCRWMSQGDLHKKYPRGMAI